MASSAVSCSSCCGPSQLSTADLQDDSSSHCYNAAPHHALADMVATAQQLAASEAFSVSGTGPPRNHLLIQASNGNVHNHSETAEACSLPLELRKLHSRQHQQTPALAAWRNVLQVHQQTPSNEHQLTRKHSACRCLYPTTNSVSKAAAAASTAPELAAEQLPITPAHTSAAIESRARHVSSSTNGQSHLQQWLSSMELRLQVPETPLLPLDSPCPVPKASILAHEGSIPAHRDSILAHGFSILAHMDNILAHRDSILADRDSILAHRDNILAHSGDVLAQGRALAQSAAAAEAASPVTTAEIGSRKRCSTSAAAAGKAAAAALLAEFNSTCKRCRTSNSSSPPPQQQQQRKLSNSSSSRTSSAVVAESVVSKVTGEVTRSLDSLPPPMFVIMGVLSREGASL